MITKLAPPLDSLDPTDWRMYCDLLQDAGASPRRWAAARQVADSLAAGKDLVLVLRCGATALQGHWLRVGLTWFVPTQLTSIEHYRTGFAWWRRDWAARGMDRYPYSASVYGARDEAKLLDFASGTPWEHKHPGFAKFTRQWTLETLKRAYFHGHGLRRMPTDWM